MVIVIPWIILCLLALFFPVIDEWNPSLESESDAWGTWQGDEYLITLNSDLTFTAKLKNESIKGTWRRMHFNVYLNANEGQERYMRFVEDSGDLLLLPEPPRDESPYPGPITKKR